MQRNKYGQIKTDKTPEKVTSSTEFEEADKIQFKTFEEYAQDDQEFETVEEVIIEEEEYEPSFSRCTGTIRGTNVSLTLRIRSILRSNLDILGRHMSEDPSKQTTPKRSPCSARKSNELPIYEKRLSS